MKKIPNVGIIPKSNIKYIDSHIPFWLGTGISVKSYGVELVLWVPTLIS